MLKAEANDVQVGVLARGDSGLMRLARGKGDFSWRAAGKMDWVRKSVKSNTLTAVTYRRSLVDIARKNHHVVSATVLIYRTFTLTT
jgi:hypothetical protein